MRYGFVRSNKSFAEGAEYETWIPTCNPVDVGKPDNDFVLADESISSSEAFNLFANRFPCPSIECASLSRVYRDGAGFNVARRATMSSCSSIEELESYLKNNPQEGIQVQIEPYRSSYVRGLVGFDESNLVISGNGSIKYDPGRAKGRRTLAVNRVTRTEKERKVREETAAKTNKVDEIANSLRDLLHECINYVDVFCPLAYNTHVYCDWSGFGKHINCIVAVLAYAKPRQRSKQYKQLVSQCRQLHEVLTDSTSAYNERITGTTNRTDRRQQRRKRKKLLKIVDKILKTPASKAWPVLPTVLG